MKALIIYAHPSTGGHNEQILKETISNLKSRKISYEVLDLYKMKYDPVLHENEHYTRGNYTVSKQNKAIQQKIKKSDLLVFIYPVWWSSMPAIMKGFIDRIFISRFAFKYVNGLPQGLLKGKKALVFITTGGSTFLTKVFMGNMPAKLIKRQILGFCGIKTKVYQLGSSNSFDEKRIPKIKKMIEKAFEKFFN
ncbi:MAG: NAD(P)H-dependent oxidoreductase [Nanoarchaeota archaeon]|nr:NAD(P)H-dependent oxidoreductase [Nanoarchaeota archaeon]MBU1320778.1 NAD(P)H-dependent oxidoreductase [Nanoarchaeota archaeon]MBU1598145.1 NAD(P)H-dependent oxidoreductase [Nanoarchaeota archaeon]MBU2442206.1 NAD(P)H-dependent oxidoreductase [Nanoarchaeota archaeon]